MGRARRRSRAGASTGLEMRQKWMKFFLGTTQWHSFAPAQPEASPYLYLFEQGLVLVKSRSRMHPFCLERSFLFGETRPKAVV